METIIYNQKGEKVSEIKLPETVFGLPWNANLVHQAAVSMMSNKRDPIAHTKGRGEVAGGGRKPWRQKGLGRARHGSIRSPIWVGGGVTFGPRNIRNFSQKINKKMKTKALFMCLSDKVANNLLTVLDDVKIETGKTKEIVGVIKNLKDILNLSHRKHKSTENTKAQLQAEQERHKFDIKKYKLSLLIILPKSDRMIFNAARNLMGIKVVTADSLNVFDLLKYERVLLTEECLPVIEKVYHN